MIPTKLEELIKKGETLYTEFKSAKVHPDALASTIVSFLNTNGGVLLLGVEDDKTITGIDDIDATIQRVEQILSNNITPRATAYIEAIEYMDSTLLKIDIKQGIDRPYHTIRGQCFIRVNAGKRLASREEIRRMYLTVTIENIRAGIHVERNPIILSLMAKLGLMTRLGTGILRILRLAKEANLPEPDFIETESEFVVILYRAKSQK